jgi:hypothetical protein
MVSVATVGPTVGNADPPAWLLLKLVLRPFAETLAETWGFSAHVRSYIIDAIAGRCAAMFFSTSLYCQSLDCCARRPQFFFVFFVGLFVSSCSCYAVNLSHFVTFSIMFQLSTICWQPNMITPVCSAAALAFVGKYGAVWWYDQSKHGVKSMQI